MTRIMIVSRADGSIYFRTDAVTPAEEPYEEAYWIALGYVVKFEEVKE